MLQLAKIRRIIGDSSLPDAELERLRDALHDLAEVIVSGYLEQQQNPSRNHTSVELSCSKDLTQSPHDLAFENLTKDLSEVDRDAAEEQAAVLEFSAGMERHDAEQEVVRQHMAFVRQKPDHPCA